LPRSDKGLSEEAREAIVEWQEVCNEEAMVEAVEKWEDQCGDQRQHMGYQNPLKGRVTDNGVHLGVYLERTNVRVEMSGAVEMQE
jgi:hypothetical protein